MDELKTNATFKLPHKPLGNVTVFFDTTPVKSPTDVNYRFDEASYLDKAQEYVARTYSQHYVGPTGYQAFEGVAAAGNGKGFAMGNIQKLAARYGKKEGYNRNDLFKIIHYAVLEMWRYDTFGEE